MKVENCTSGKIVVIGPGLFKLASFDQPKMHRKGANVVLIYIVMNSRFVPRTERPTFIYGVVQHAVAGGSALSELGLSVRYLLYNRNEEISSPIVTSDTVFTRGAACIHFNFTMKIEEVANAFRLAIQVAGKESKSKSSILYFQTATLLHFAPPEYPVIVTSHGPFVEDVEARIGRDAARLAFNWDHDKIEALRAAQRAGLETMKARDRLHCCEISAIQTKYVISSGVDPERVSRISPPLDDRPQSSAEFAGDSKVLNSFSNLPRRGVAFTAVARLDYFKRIDLFVEGSIEATKRGVISGFVLIGGDLNDSVRDRLWDRVPDEYKDRCLFLPRQPHQFLTDWLFPWLAEGGVFVCTSRFDLVPYTILEAAGAGVPVLAPRSVHVGAVEYLSTFQQFEPSPEGLCGGLEWAMEKDISQPIFEECSRRIKKDIGRAQFAQEFLRVCAIL